MMPVDLTALASWLKGCTGFPWKHSIKTAPAEPATRYVPMQCTIWNAGNIVAYCNPQDVDLLRRAPEMARALAEREKELQRLTTLRPREEWGDDDADVLWHHAPQGELSEPPVCCTFQEMEEVEPWPGYYTHWSPLPRVENLPAQEPALSTPVDNAEGVAGAC
jgi:hypothetical protein